jgi:hypothetical protein
MPAVRRIVTSYLQNFRPLAIDRKKLGDILEILSQNSEAVDTVFFDDEYEYKSLAEIEQSSNVKIRRIEIKTHEPYATVTLGKQPYGKFLLRDNNSLYAEAGTKGEALFLKVRETLIRRQRVLSYFFRWWIYVGSFAINMSTLYKPWYSFLKAHFGTHIDGFITLSTGLYQLAFMYFMFRGMSDIKLESRSQGSFLTRNRDDLWKLGLAALAGAILTEVVHALVSHFTQFR